MAKKLNMQLSEEQTAQYLSIMRKKTLEDNTVHDNKIARTIYSLAQQYSGQQ